MLSHLGRFFFYFLILFYILFDFKNSSLIHSRKINCELLFYDAIKRVQRYLLFTALEEKINSTMCVILSTYLLLFFKASIIDSRFRCAMKNDVSDAHKTIFFISLQPRNAIFIIFYDFPSTTLVIFIRIDLNLLRAN